MVVVARVLRVEPADQPDVEVRVAIELDEVARARIVADEALPEARLTREVDDQLRERRPVEVHVLRHPLVNPAGRVPSDE